MTMIMMMISGDDDDDDGMISASVLSIDIGISTTNILTAVLLCTLTFAQPVAILIAGHIDLAFHYVHLWEAV